ncbi:hypothetical protein H5410_009548, partial [Solanum commersonii]
KVLFEYPDCSILDLICKSGKESTTPLLKGSGFGKTSSYIATPEINSTRPNDGEFNPFVDCRLRFGVIDNMRPFKSSLLLLLQPLFFVPLQPEMTPKVGATLPTTNASHPSNSCLEIGQGVDQASINGQDESVTIIPPAETQPSVQILVEYPNLATSIQYGISSLPVIACNHSDVKEKGEGKTSGSRKIDNRKEKSLMILAQNFVKLFHCSDVDLISLDKAASTLLGDVHDPMAMKNALYDFANVFVSMNLIEKIHSPDNGKPVFRWIARKENLGVWVPCSC